MYSTQTTADLIKLVAKSKNISIGKMLADCDLSKNALSSMQSRGSWLQANNLAKIADYLDCSIDYLLGRTDVPEVNHGDNYRYAQMPHYAQAAASTGRELGKSQSPDDVDEISALQEYEKNK